MGKKKIVVRGSPGNPTEVRSGKRSTPANMTPAKLNQTTAKPQTSVNRGTIVGETGLGF